MIKTILEAILPIFFAIFLGWFAGKKGIVKHEHKKSLINFVTILALPLILFNTTSLTPIENFSDFKIIFIIIVALLTTFFTSYFICKIVFVMNNKEASISALTTSFPNSTFIGIPLLLQLFDSNAMTSIVIITILSTVLLIPIAIIIMESHESHNVSLIKHIRSLLLKPMIIAPILGLVFSAFDINTPNVVHSSFSLIGNTAPAIALFTMGLGISHSKLIFSKKVFTLIFAKNIITPIIFLFLLTIFKVSNQSFKEILILSALPTGVIVPMLASQYGALEIESNSAATLGTLLSIFTLGVIIFIIS